MWFKIINIYKNILNNVFYKINYYKMYEGQETLIALKEVLPYIDNNSCDIKIENKEIHDISYDNYKDL